MIKQGEINIDKHQLRDEIATFFTAGHDSNHYNGIECFALFLAKYPEMQEKARAEVIRILGNEPIIPSLDQLKELKYVNAIIKETLRTHPPTPILNC
ncbi:unnamed protein product [Rhizophagus irregularis]|nr:unnamed protein product [Rhizophagus irregularis]